jgi:hypothetical protein
MRTRREFLAITGGLALIPLISTPAVAAEKLPLDDPAAKALKYVEDASQASGKTDKMGVVGADQLCSNCRFYTAPDGEFGPCTLFQNRLVAGKGWCAGWVPTA